MTSRDEHEPVVFTNDISELQIDKHVTYIQSLDTHKDSLEYWLTEHLRLNGVYWGLTALHLLGRPDGLPRQGTIDFVKSCYHINGGFSAAPNHDPHMLYTLSAIQILVEVDALNEIDQDAVVKYIAGLQNPKTGAFAGDEWGEEDTRFIYTAINALSLLGRLDVVNVDAAVNYVLRCQNYDGGFGVMPDAESHSGQIFTCLGVLKITNNLHRLSPTQLDLCSSWLSERQLPHGALNGRPEKLEDVCYGWWVLSSLSMIDRLHWIDKSKVAAWILTCQDTENGGFADRKGHPVDVFHTLFAITGLSLVGFGKDVLGEIDATYCLPKKILDKALRKHAEQL